MDKWTVRADARTGPLAVDNTLSCPPRGPLPTCPQPAATTFKKISKSIQIPSDGRYKVPSTRSDNTDTTHSGVSRLVHVVVEGLAFVNDMDGKKLQRFVVNHFESTMLYIA